MNPVLADGSAAAILEGWRRAMAEKAPAEPPASGARSLMDVVESATAHAQGLAPRLAGCGRRIDRTV